MSTGKVKKIHRVTLLGSRRGTYNCSAYYQQRRGWCFYQRGPAESLLRPRFPATQQPEPEQLFPVSTPAALFTSDSPGNTSSPGNSQPSVVAPNPNNSSGYYPDSLLAPVAAGPAGILNRTIYRVIHLQQCYYNHWHTKYCCWLRCWYLGYPEQFVGLFPATSAALIPNPEYS